MAHDNFHDDEASEAQDRIDRIRRGGKPQVDDSFDNERVVESRSRIQRVRETLEEAESDVSRGRSAQLYAEGGRMGRITCPLCGFEFDPDDSTRCSGCVLKSKDATLNALRFT